MQIKLSFLHLLSCGKKNTVKNNQQRSPPPVIRKKDISFHSKENKCIFQLSRIDGLGANY